MKFGIILLLAVFILFCNSVEAQSPKLDAYKKEALNLPLESAKRLKLLAEVSRDLRAFAVDSVSKYALEYQETAIAQSDTTALIESYRLLSWSRGLRQQNIAQLVKDGQTALQLAQTIGDSLEILKTGLSLSAGYIPMRKIAESQEFVDLSLTYAKKHKNNDLLYEAYSYAAYLAFISDLNKSLEYRESALVIAEELNDSIKIAATLSQLASLAKLQKSEKAGAYLQRGKEILRNHKAPLYEGILLFYLAEYYGDLGYADSLIYYGLEANRLADETQNVQVKRVVKALLFAYYFNRKEFEKAAPFASEALKIEQAKPSINFVSAFVDQARVKSALGQKDSAEVYFQQALAATKLIPYPRAEELARVYYGEFLKFQKRYPEALEQLRIAKKIGESDKEAAVKDFVLLQLAEVEFLNGNFSNSRELYKEVLSLGNEKDEADLFAQVYQGLAKCDSAQGRWKSAYDNQLIFLQWNDSNSNRNYNQKVAEYEVKFETTQREAEIKQLEQDNRIQDLEINQTKTQNNFLLGIAIILALAGIIVGILMFRLNAQNTEISAQREGLAQLNKTKDQLFAMISHDLRGPITGFQSSGKIFNHYLEKGDYERLAVVSQKLNSQSNQLRQLLDNLLNWSLQQLGRYKPQEEEISLKALGEEIFSRYQSHATAKNNKLLMEIDENLSWYGDKNGLSVALNNLVGNAMKFTQDGKISLTAHKEAGKLRIEIKDTGIGMSDEQKNSLFSEEVGLSNPGTAGEKGTGLGNQIVRQLLDYIGGNVSVDSQSGKGTSIILELPS
ncbi:MAG: ATP-binding protein [Bacteroidia bacterium]|nr:ATP-binding protein [Bacteroidia bacterium]